MDRASAEGARLGLLHRGDPAVPAAPRREGRRWGYVERTGDPDDGRKVILVATPAGAALIAETRRRRYAWLNAQLGALSVSERRLLSAATSIINKIADS